VTDSPRKEARNAPIAERDVAVTRSAAVWSGPRTAAMAVRLFMLAAFLAPRKGEYP